jgi:hypothetical protein
LETVDRVNTGAAGGVVAVAAFDVEVSFTYNPSKDIEQNTLYSLPSSASTVSSGSTGRKRQMSPSSPQAPMPIIEIKSPT